jgi:putative tryptophan/tyrosine transport system substrate-binding protein
MNRRQVVALLGGAAGSWPLAASAQRHAMSVIGYLGGGFPEPSSLYLAAIRKGLGETGYVEGRNIRFEYRWAEGSYDRLPALAAELVGRNVDVIVTSGGTPAARAAKNATSTIPIVFANVGDPVGGGLVTSLARPEGNVTGLSILASEMTAKRLELLCELVPQARSIAFLVNPTNAVMEPVIRDLEQAARLKDVQLPVVRASTEQEIAAAFTTLHQLHAEAVVVGADPFYSTRRDQLAALAAHHAVPAIYLEHEFATSGGLISYGPSFIAVFRQVGSYAGKRSSTARSRPICRCNSQSSSSWS